MGNTLAFDNEEQLISLIDHSNSGSLQKRSFSNFDLSSGLSSRTASLNCISTPENEDSISNILSRISERIIKTNGIIYFLSNSEQKSELNENQDHLYGQDFIFETLDLAEKKAEQEMDANKVCFHVDAPNKEAKNNSNNEVLLKLERKESTESSEVSRIDIGTHSIHRSVYIHGKNTTKVPNKIRIRSRQFIIFGNKNNHKPFLSPGIIDIFLPYILDESLLSCFLVCPHWFLTLSEYINNKYCIPIDHQFKESYGKYLDLEYSTVTIQPVLTVGGSVRIDRVLYAKVLKSCMNKTTCLSYSFKYKGTSQIRTGFEKEKSLSQKNTITPIIQPLTKYSSKLSSHTDDVQFVSCFKFETNKMGSKMTQWAHKDMSRCHCEEVAVAQTTTKSNVNVGDRVEIAINLSNSFGIVDVKSINFLPLCFEVINPEKCEIEDVYTAEMDWRFYNSEDGEINEFFNIPDLLPQLKIISIEYAGTDIITCKITYKAVFSGYLANSKDHFGVDISVVPKGCAIISALKRKGLQHDRYSPVQMRVDDQLIFYISKGGAIPT
ncbi:hypothetical protein OJ253_1292 [Cryptosporidium canis]|uniref:Uncharacterized protein n=1 Tax=Cryptosporidium canis TaxID=195482 RepID=A0A9D5DKG4_9CRYT|nr:hypothetical protein OJ253_1292 [Cryptosporidium canis]